LLKLVCPSAFLLVIPLKFFAQARLREFPLGELGHIPTTNTVELTKVLTLGVLLVEYIMVHSVFRGRPLGCLRVGERYM